MFTLERLKASVAFVSLAAVTWSASAQTLVVPQVTHPDAQSYLAALAKDYPGIRGNVVAAFAVPASLSPLPCEVPHEDLIRIVGAVGLEDESPEVRRAYARAMRKMGPEYVKSEYHFENLAVQAIRAECRNGKLEGDVELWVTGSFISNAINFIGTQKILRRVSFKAENGKPVGMIRTWSRGVDESRWLDPAVDTMMNNGENKMVDAWSMEYRQLGVVAPNVSFSFVELTNPRSVSEVISVKTPLPNGGYEAASYKHQQLASTQQFKNGVTHGLMVIYPSKDGFVKEKIVKCVRNGEYYQANPCDVD